MYEVIYLNRNYSRIYKYNNKIIDLLMYWVYYILDRNARRTWNDIEMRTVQLYLKKINMRTLYLCYFPTWTLDFISNKHDVIRKYTYCLNTRIFAITYIPVVNKQRISEP